MRSANISMLTHLIYHFDIINYVISIIIIRLLYFPIPYKYHILMTKKFFEQLFIELNPLRFFSPN